MSSALGMIGGGIASGLGSILGGNAVQSGANTANSNLNNWYSTLNTNYSPYTTAGSGAMSQLSNDVSNGTGFATPFNLSSFMNGQQYNFALQQGQNGINNSAAAQGGMLSGATLKGLASFNSGLANQTYNSAYQNYLSNRQEGYNELAGTAGMGLNATTSLGNLGTQIAGLQSSNTMNAAGAKAASYAGAGNAIGAGLSNLSQYYAMLNSGGGGGASGSMMSMPNYGMD